MPDIVVIVQDDDFTIDSPVEDFVITQASEFTIDEPDDIQISTGDDDFEITEVDEDISVAIDTAYELQQVDEDISIVPDDINETVLTYEQGVQGPRGAPGAAGADGPPGPEGPPGTPGTDGAQGPQGDPGPIGPEGPQGDVGPAGADGAPGEQGPIGPEGPKGDQGDPGPQGNQGPQGEMGPAGNPGLDGDDGFDGWSPALAVVSDGQRRVLQIAAWVGGEGTPPASGGYIGPSGIVSDIALATDIRGPQGIQGVQGNPGIQGPPGPEGPEGPQGDPATNLVTSVHGRQGVVVGVAGDYDFPKISGRATNAQIVTMPANRIKGALSAGDQQDLTGAEVRSITGAKETLAASRVYYVSKTGSDSNDGLSSGTAFLTIQKAIDVATALVIPALMQISILIDDGIYDENILMRNFDGGGLIQMTGDTATPANVRIAGVTAADVVQHHNIFTRWAMNGLDVYSNSGGIGVGSRNSSMPLTINGNMRYGDCGAAQLYMSAGNISIISSYSVYGTSATHVRCESGSTLICNTGLTITSVLTTTYTAAFMMVIRFAYASMAAFTFTGTFVGKRFQLDGNAIVFTNTSNLSYFPGTVAGTTDGTCIYNTKQIDIETNIEADVITNIMLANMAANTFKARRTSLGDPEDLSVADAQALLGITGVVANIYNPGTMTLTANLASASCTFAMYLRIGSMCVVAGRFTADATTAAVLTKTEMTLPIASNFGSPLHLAGTFMCDFASQDGGRIEAEATNDKALFVWTPSSAAAQNYGFIFMYFVI